MGCKISLVNASTSDRQNASLARPPRGALRQQMNFGYRVHRLRSDSKPASAAVNELFVPEYRACVFKKQPSHCDNLALKLGLRLGKKDTGNRVATY
jgi:hypothetical protein